MHMLYPGTLWQDDSCEVCIWHEGESKWSHTAVAQYFVTTKVFSWESRKHSCFLKKKPGYGSFIQLTNIFLFIKARPLFGPKGYTCEHKTNHRAKVQKDHTQRKTLLFVQKLDLCKKKRERNLHLVRKAHQIVLPLLSSIGCHVMQLSSIQISYALFM